ncbi:ABC-type multidrug transport system fused ATPase/permease subunit/predicted double-glycine peptidase [Mesorhizobium soli]|uniref:cysteine peptidase family C39 domain-containing protein n=1 Tax=Pseudaminobacter soli (ex Li et al. 2025) TaxID=1295366 RepID=UPI00247457CC|nr:cysteine peptidase family C39 domain-containing protein [Mesorhizobium soli]MDH6233115.1 ABC-type multidrug transport system fused ATPase/permease subunit/predicted double-glycine peptidase [Mesorhizobium soli]
MGNLTKENGRLPAGGIRVRTPEVRQGEHAECGLAALSIVLGHHGLHVPMAELRQQAGTTLFGSTIRQLRDIARSYGFEAKAHRTEPKDMSVIGLPLIAHMRFIHFVVVECIGSAVVHVNDPSCGPVVLDRAEFDRDFTGIVLSVKPETVARRGRPFSFATALLDTWKPQWAKLALAGVASVTGGIAATAGIWRLASHGPASLGMDFLLLAASLCTSWLAILLVEQVGLDARRRWSSDLYAALGKAGNEHYLFSKPEQTLAQFSALDHVQNSNILRALLTVLWLLAALASGTALALGPVLPVALISLLQIGLLGWAATRRGSRIARNGHAELSAHGIDAEHLADSDWYRIGQASDGLFSRVAGHHALVASEFFKTANERRRMDTTLFGLDMVKIAAPFSIAAAQGEIAGLVLALSVAAAGSVMLRRIGRDIHFQPLKNALHRLGDLPVEVVKDPPASPRSAGGKFRMENAGWYPGGINRPPIESVSVSLSRGEVLVVNGASGAGATTFARLASGMLDPTEGIVTLGGIPLAEHPPTVAILVDHFVPIVPGTLRENLSFGASGIGDTTMLAALRLVGLDDVLAPRGGLSLILKADQPRLSGGQLRRIAIARALCRSPRLLVLDEALDNVETSLAKTILSRLRALGMILVVTTKNADLLAAGDQRLDLGVANAA